MSPDCFKLGGVVPQRCYEYFWRRRHSNHSIYKKVRRLDVLAGAWHDFISENIEESLERFHRFKQKYPSLADLEAQVAQTDGVVINGEGTLIFGNPTKRDALYLLFIIALARFRGKPVFLLNAMITQDPYAPANDAILKQAAGLLRYCTVVACRDPESFDFTTKALGCSAVRLIPDALFTWGERFRQATLTVRQHPEIILPYGSTMEPGDWNFNEPYICVSASSSAWRSAKATGASLVQLATTLKSTGLRIYFISTCAGDRLLCEAAKEAGVAHIPQDIPVLAGAGIIAGASAYLTGRYHPAIMAGAGGVPTVFFSANSHKIKTVQPLLGYEPPKLYSINPSASEISAISSEVSNILGTEDSFRQKIRSNFEIQARRAREFETVIDH